MGKNSDLDAGYDAHIRELKRSFFHIKGRDCPNCKTESIVKKRGVDIIRCHHVFGGSYNCEFKLNVD